MPEHVCLEKPSQWAQLGTNPQDATHFPRKLFGLILGIIAEELMVNKP